MSGGQMRGFELLGVPFQIPRDNVAYISSVGLVSKSNGRAWRPLWVSPYPRSIRFRYVRSSYKAIFCILSYYCHQLKIHKILTSEPLCFDSCDREQAQVWKSSSHPLLHESYNIRDKYSEPYFYPLSTDYQRSTVASLYWERNHVANLPRLRVGA